MKARPKLTELLFPAFRDLFARGARSTAYRSRYNLIYFWRFLNHQEDLSAILDPENPIQIDHLTWQELEALWRHFLDWLRSKSEAKMSSRTKYYINATAVQVFEKAHALDLASGTTDKTYLNIYVFFRDTKKSAYADDDVLSFEDAKKAFKVLARSWRNILNRFSRGRELAASGRDPMTGSSGASRWEGGPWQSLANRLWVIRELAPFNLGKGQTGEIDVRIRSGLGHPLPSGCFPHVFGFGLTGGLWTHMACIYPTLNEVAVAFAMVTIKSGLNPDAVAGMRVDHWHRQDPMYPGARVVIFGPKRIAGRMLHASSSVHRNTDPYRLITAIIELLAPFRAHVLEHAKRTGDRQLEELSHLVWTFPTSFGVGSFSPGTNGANTAYKYLDGLFADACLTRDDGNPLTYRFSQGRDVWGLFVYHKSGFNHVLTAQALGHSSLTSLLHYLEKRTLKTADRKRLIELQGKVLTDLKNGSFAPRQYREQIEVAARAATGLSCVDPTHPAPDADPGNPGGKLCRSQGCWACHNWYATIESLPHLIRMITDLKEMREITPIAAWETSDYPSMLDVYGFIVSKFHRDHVAKAEEVARNMRPIVTTTRFTTAGRFAV